MPPASCNTAASPPVATSEPHAGATITIGDRTIGAGQRAYIIAEAGVNHDGSVETALRLVEAAVTAGADAVKFQVFRAAELVTAGAATAGYQRAAGARSQRDMLRRLELVGEDFARIREHCQRSSIEFLATPFSPPDVGRLEALGVRAIKLASTDLNNTPLLKRAAETGLPLIVSTGAATAQEMRVAFDRLRAWGASRRVALLHCVSCYPAPLEAANLRAIGALGRTFGVPCGFSDHTVSTEVGGWAVAAGACVLEKHFTLDRSAAGPDHAMSLSPVELTEYVAGVRAAEVALGNGALGMTELEADVRAAARKSVVAAAAMRAGAVLTEDLLTVKRPGGGIEPDQLDELVGRRLLVDVADETPLTWDMIA